MNKSAIVAGFFVLAVLGCASSALAAVGRTAGTFAVTPRGAASYSIALWAPPGPHGLQPNLSLVYNSQSGDGPEGVGWSIAGLSSIYRCNATVAQDSAAAGITLTYADRFCMDGKRLRLTSSENLSTYGAGGTTYQTELADFSNVTAHGAAGNGPAYFTVQGKNGWTYEYGHTNDSQLLGSGTTAFAWMLDKVTDHAGNTMVIVWRVADANLTGMTVPASISWTPSSHGSSTYDYTMLFNYQALPLAVKAGYLAGQPVQNYYTLTSIQVGRGGTTAKVYFLGYTLSGTTGRQTLTSITECADTAQSNCLSPTTFQYPPGQAGLGSATTLTTQAGFAPIARYDFNGDGRTDLTWYENGTWWVAFATSTGYSTPVNTGITDGAALMDSADGSGTDGFLAQNSPNWYWYKWNGSSFVGTDTHIALDSTRSGSFALADVDGDGRPDLLTTHSDNYLYVRFNTSQGGSVSFSTSTIKTILSPSPGTLATSVGTRRADFRGTGQQDIFVLIGGAHPTVNILHFTGSTFVTILSSVDAPIDVADYNDDGCSDLLYPTRLVISSCNGSAWTTINLSQKAIAGMDWDADGRRDIIVVNGSTLGVYKSTGTGISSTLITTSISSSAAYFAVADNATGDGLDALVTTGSSGNLPPYTIQYYLHNGAGQLPDLLSSVIDGYGNSATPTYVSIAQGDYTKGSGAQAGYENYIGPMYVVNKVTFSDPSNAGRTYYQSYSYADGWRSLAGRGFSAFQSIQKYDSRNALWETFGYDYYFPYAGNPVADEVTFDQGRTQPIRYSFASNEQALTLDGNANNQRYFVFNDMTTQLYQVSWSPSAGSTAGPLIETDTTNFTYDNYGNATSTSVTHTDQASGSPYNGISWTTTTTLTPYIDDPSYSGSAQSAWCVGLIENRKVQYTGGPSGSTAVTRTQSSTANAPDLATCRLTTLITEPASSQYEVTEAFAYDAFGNVSTDTVTGINMSSRQTSSTGRPPPVSFS